MRITITIDTGGDAFTDNPEEVHDLLMEIARAYLYEQYTSDAVFVHAILDSNGNKCGHHTQRESP